MPEMQPSIPQPNQAVPGGKGITGNALKWLAMVIMVIDHIGAFVLEPYITMQQAPAAWLTPLDLLMRSVGRLAFPIFYFLLVEGFFHTHDRRKYLLHLVIFALISDPIFDFANSYTWFDPTGQNVFFTLALGLLAIWCLDTFTAKGQPLLGWGGVVLFCVAAQLTQTDYSFLGVALILTFYLCRGKKSLYYAVPAVLLIGDFALVSIHFLPYFSQPGVSVIPLLLINALQETLGALSLLFIARYNGQRGGHMPKYFFYAFYPAHILLLAGIRVLLLGA